MEQLKLYKLLFCFNIPVAFPYRNAYRLNILEPLKQIERFIDYFRPIHLSTIIFEKDIGL